MMEPLFYQFATIFIRLIRVGFGCSLEVSGYWLLAFEFGFDFACSLGAINVSLH